MVFGKKCHTKKFQKVNLSMSNIKIHQVQNYKYLGVMLDENLNFNCHVNSIIRNVTHKMNMLRRVSQFLTEKASLLIYKAFILPIMEYSNILYLNSSSKV